jgi:hypothetical protein
LSPLEVLSSLRFRGVSLSLSADGLRIRTRGGAPEDYDLIAREKGWLLMLLHHEVGADAPDPRLAFLVSGEDGLTRGAVETRMVIALGIGITAAAAFVDLALAEGFLVVEGDLLFPRGRTASGFELVRERDGVLA